MLIAFNNKNFFYIALYSTLEKTYCTLVACDFK